METTNRVIATITSLNYLQ